MFVAFRSLNALQHFVDERSKVRLDCVEFTLEYRDWLGKVVDDLGTGDLGSGLIGITASSGVLRDAPIS